MRTTLGGGTLSVQAVLRQGQHLYVRRSYSTQCPFVISRKSKMACGKGKNHIFGPFFYRQTVKVTFT
ncbi:unnamed protein product [Ixodes pacificus]